ncbi:MAG TPA: phosphosulfolactate synthase [Ktedonobacteraceae bacterium]
MSYKSEGISTREYLHLIGVPEILPRTSPFDPGYDVVTLESHLEQSAHLIENLKISMSCWLIAKEEVTRRKFAAARAHGIPVITGGGPFEIAAAQGQLEAYLDICADLGGAAIECGEGFTSLSLQPRTICSMARERGLTVQFEMGKKHEGVFTEQTLQQQIANGYRWLEAGAEALVVEARESARDVGLFDGQGEFDPRLADTLANTFGLSLLRFEAPTKSSQFELLAHFGRDVHLCNVRLEEILRVEIFRRGLHADSFILPGLRPELNAGGSKEDNRGKE